MVVARVTSSDAPIPNPLRVAVVHNRYQHRGGEDQVFEAETRILEDKGNQVLRYTVSNATVPDMGRLELAISSIWNRDQYRALRSRFRELHPHVVHVHNTLPIVSPAVYYAARREGAAVAQTLHNFRPICPSGILFRKGHVCEDCVGKTFPWPAVVHACYRSSRAATAAVAGSEFVHRLAGTYNRMVDQYIALTQLARDKFVAGGLPQELITVKPNFLETDAGEGAGTGGYALFVGRLSEEKGVRVLIEAWRRVSTDLPLRIAGSGPLEEWVRTSIRGQRRVSYLGQLPKELTIEQIRNATFLVFPSVWYEGFPMTIVEALSAGTPIIASRQGAMAEVLDHGRTGILFCSGDPSALAAAVDEAMSRLAHLAKMRKWARAKFEELYSREAGYRMLLDAYSRAISVRAAKSSSA